MEEEAVLEWLTNLEAMELADKIEEVNGKILETLIKEKDYLAVLFYKEKHKESELVLVELENIDDEADQLGIGFVKTSERELFDKYGLDTIPALAYYRKTIPLLYEGDLRNEEEVLKWLEEFKNVDDEDDDVIEDVSADNLESMIDKTDILAVFVYDANDKDQKQILEELETIDDDLDQHGIPFVKTDDVEFIKKFGLESTPQLIYFENGVPQFYKDDMTNEERIMNWLVEQKMEDEIEEVTEDVLEDLIENSDFLAVLIYDKGDEKSEDVLAELENIDDECDQHDIPFVKIDDPDVVKQFGVDVVPALLYFEGGIPNYYPGNLLKEQEVLDWLIRQKESDEIEDVTPEILEALIQRSDYLAVLFYDRDDEKSQRVLKELENIDDEADEHDLPFIKIDDDQVARDYGIDDELPCLVYFENEIPSIYHGDLSNEEQVLDWLIEQINSDSIEEVTDKILENLVEKNQHVAVIFYEMKNKKIDKKTERVIKELEEIDDEADEHFVLFLKTHDPNASKKYGIEVFPTLVFFDRTIPNIYHGDLLKEEEVLAWFVRQKTSEEIEEITEEMLKELVEENQKIVVLFYDKEVDSSKDVLDDLENIDDDLDKLGIPFVKIDDDSIAKDFGILDELPALVYFEDEIPSVYEGDLHNEEKALKWIVKQAQEDTIEEVTEEMLDYLVKDKEYVLVFYAPDNCKECPSILSELEKIDDESDDHGVVFVTTDDTKLAKKAAGINKLPAIVLFRNGQPMVYKGDLEDEDSLLKWLTSEDTLDIPDTIEQINQKMLSKLIEKNDFVAVLFTKDKCPLCDKVLLELENIDDEAEAMDVDFVRVNDAKVARAYDIENFPAVIFFRKKFPQYYTGDLMDEDAVLAWITQQKEKGSLDEIEDVDRPMLEMLLDQMEAVAVVFYSEDCKNCDKVLEELENIDDDTDKYGIYFVKTDDMEYANELGVSETPSLVYFENHSPSIYFGDLENEEAVLEWLIKQRTEDTIENINRDMLSRMIEETDYLAVFFYKARDDESQEILKALENIDDDCADYEVHLVAMVDNLMAKKYGIRDPPGLAYFRHGKHIKFTGDLYDPEEVLEWLTNPENMEMDDAIERVNKRMFERMMGKVESLAVFFYSKTTCKQCSRVLEELEKIDDEADAQQIKMVKIDDQQLARKYGVYALPAFLFFRKDDPDPVIYAGDFKTGENMLEWMLLQKNPDSERIEEMAGDELRDAIKEEPSIACYFYNRKCLKCDGGANVDEDKVDCEECRKTLEELENIDDDTERHGIKFVKSCDHTVAKELGVRRYPTLVYFENGCPSIYEGDLSGEEEVLQWLITQKTEDTIETVNRDMLEKLVESTHYLGVFFYKSHCRACDQALLELEKIDDDTDMYGIHLVKIQDVGLAKRYGIKTFPALMYFRNGNPLIFEGDLKNEEQVLEWLTDDDNRELSDEIEEVNERMLERLVENSPFLAVLFIEDDCDDCERSLKELENIDDEADVFGIDFVKINSLQAAAKYDITTFPTLAYFRKGKATVYDVEHNNPDCDAVLKELEHIDDEAEELDIMLLKINDVKYAKKYGINKVPAIVYLRRKFPSIFRGDLMDEEQVLEWLRRNRYRQPELNLFMYALIMVAVGFIGYTLFLIFCLKDVKDKRE
ncbi:uncharacterized protein LOC100903717 [Galendromus occidentalis]|uniref:Uncharacterized protein LOC100903717 n=1 Tax=Galendromus occidentalis TaxID=34638 RepID=A0AAJ7SGX9_9ACAR|nr:uncharacterized protein LOC100903717 [Galendromus occidentalis]